MNDESRPNLCRCGKPRRWPARTCGAIECSHTPEEKAARRASLDRRLKRRQLAKAGVL